MDTAVRLCCMSERREIARDGAKAQKNSGRGRYQKGDAIDGGYLVDYKEYEKSFGVSTKVWTKVCTDAVKSGVGLEPAIKVILGPPGQHVRLAIISWEEFQRLRELDGKIDE
jgi:hypothetical protein